MEFNNVICGFQMSNLPRLTSVSVDLENNASVAKLHTEIRGEFPALKEFYLMMNMHFEEPTRIVLDLLQHAPNMDSVILNGENSTLVIDDVWKAGPNLKRIDHNYQTFFPK